MNEPSRIEEHYDPDFYDWVADQAAPSAAAVVPLILHWTAAASLVDVGCGTGAWARAFSDAGVADVVGIDSHRVPADALVIPTDRFLEADLARPGTAPRRFDVAVSLEVAEHLPPESASPFVDFLCELSSVVVFSAAIPGQGGEEHLDERWPAEWAALFDGRGYRCHDILRPRIWNDERIAGYYRQNVLVFADAEATERLGLGAVEPRLPDAPLPLVHPTTFAEHLESARRRASVPLSVSAHLRQLPGALGSAIRWRLQRTSTPAG